MAARLRGWSWILGSCVALAACSAASGAANGDGSTGGTSGGGSGGGGGAAAAGGLGGGGFGALGGGGSGGGGGYTDPGQRLTETPACTPDDPNVDADLDGASTAGGDCNDCSRQIGPGAVDWPGNGVDEDCSGTADDEPACDEAAGALASDDPWAAAAAIGLCRKATATGWGVVEARYTKADGSAGMSPMSHGLLEAFGSLAPRAGTSMLALSSGTARAPGQTGYQAPAAAPGANPPGGSNLCTRCPFPPGYPIAAQGCGIPPEDGEAFDSAALELVLRVPTNANALGFDFDFFTTEYPAWVCDQYNDLFATFFDPAPTGALSGNVSFDSERDPISVNSGLLAICDPGKNTVGAPYPCPDGPSALAGTGYDTGAATGWVRSRAFVPPGQTLRVRFTVWDTADWMLDSLVLVDNAAFDVDGSAPETNPVR